MNQRSFLALALWLAYSAAQSGFATERYQDRLMLELLTAVPGTVVEIPAGSFEIDTQLSLAADGVTLRGQGMGKSVLSFKGQSQGAEGLLVTGNGALLQDFTIEDTRGDAIKVNRADGVTIRAVEARWTRGPHRDNGAYGLYPVQSRHVLIEGCRVSGASDAGIYVGQSQQVIVRHNIATHNVAGIEVENSRDVDVYNNYSTNNTGGILIFNLPKLSIAGERTRIFNNVIVANNTLNFAPAGNTVADVPTGTGVMITANKHVEVFANLIADNNTANMLLVGYRITARPIADPAYNPYVESVYIYDNTFLGGGTNPQGGSSAHTQDLIAALKEIIGTPFPHLIYDGSYHPQHTDSQGQVPANLKVCIGANHELSFLNLDVNHNFQNINSDLGPHRCTQPKLPAVVLNAGGQ